MPGVSDGPFGGFGCLRLLVGLVYCLLGGLPPLRGQGTGPPTHRAVAVAVRIVVLQRGGQQSGQRSRPASGRASDGISPAAAPPECLGGLLDVGFGGAVSWSHAAEPVELTAFGCRRGADRRRPGGGQVPGAPGQRAPACLGALVVGRFHPRQQARQPLRPRPAPPHGPCGLVPAAPRRHVSICQDA